MADILNNLQIDKEVAPSLGALSLAFVKQEGVVAIYNFKSQDDKVVSIPEDADYLLFFSQVAERVYGESENLDLIFQGACNIEGSKFFFKEFSKEEQEKYRYPSIALSASLKTLSADDYSGRVGFSSTLSYVRASDPTYVKESQKVAKILKGENKEDWMLITENKYDFIKTDTFVLDLQKLHSWGFQAVNPGQETKFKKSLVRPIRPKPRGAIRNRKTG